MTYMYDQGNSHNAIFDLKRKKMKYGKTSLDNWCNTIGQLLKYLLNITDVQGSLIITTQSNS
jgi:hypothetical protein